MLLPLYAFVEGDTLGLLVLAQSDDTVRSLADRMIRSASPRIAIEGEVAVMQCGVELKLDDTLATAGLKVLDRVDLRRRHTNGR